jgi:hypothetical protein
VAPLLSPAMSSSPELGGRKLGLGLGATMEWRCGLATCKVSWQQEHGGVSAFSSHSDLERAWLRLQGGLAEI